MQRLPAGLQLLQLLLGVADHLRIGFGLEQDLGLLDVLTDLLEFEVRLDALGEGAVFPGDARIANAVGRDSGVGQLLFQLAVTD